MGKERHTPPSLQPSRRGASSESGDTLIEVLFAIAILGIAVTALLGALLATITSASEHRNLASLDTVLRSYAEQLKYDVELQPNGASWFTQCAPSGGSSYGTHTVTPPANQPSDFAVTITGIQYWNYVSNQFDSTCGTNDQSGFQLITLQAMAPNGQSEQLSVGLRQP